MKRTQFTKQMLTILLRRRQALRQLVTSDLTELAYIDSVGDTCDEAQESTDRAIFAQLAQTESRELEAIETALQKMRNNEYGICDDCGRNIPVARMRAIPHASTCIDCQRAAERSRESNRIASHWNRISDFDPNDDGPSLSDVESMLM